MSLSRICILEICFFFISMIKFAHEVYSIRDCAIQRVTFKYSVGLVVSLNRNHLIWRNLVTFQNFLAKSAVTKMLGAHRRTSNADNHRVPRRRTTTIFFLISPTSTRLSLLREWPCPTWFIYYWNRVKIRWTYFPIELNNVL